MNYIMKPPAQSSPRQSAMKCAAIVTALLLGNFPAAAGPPTCQRELGAIDLALIKSVLHLRGVAHRQHVTTMSKAREVFERCLSGATRDIDLQQLTGALDDANGVIARCATKGGRAFSLHPTRRACHDHVEM